MSTPPSPRLAPLELWLRPEPAPLLPQLRAALAAAGGEPLRWAITAVDPERGLRLEGVVLTEGGPRQGSPR
jgi:hypothetical protein